MKIINSTKIYDFILYIHISITSYHLQYTITTTYYLFEYCIYCYIVRKQNVIYIGKYIFFNRYYLIYIYI